MVRKGDGDPCPKGGGHLANGPPRESFRPDGAHHPEETCLSQTGVSVPLRLFRPQNLTMWSRKFWGSTDTKMRTHRWRSDSLHRHLGRGGSIVLVARSGLHYLWWGKAYA
jgi:hypothetical protein